MALMFFENYRFSSFFCKRSNKIQGSTMQSLKTLKLSEPTWPLRKQPSFSWMLLVRLQKNWRICCFQKPLWLDNLLPSEPRSSSRNVILARTIAKLSTRIRIFWKTGIFFSPFSKKRKKSHPRVSLKFESFLSVPRSKTLKRWNYHSNPYGAWSMRHAISIWRTVNIRI